MQIEDARNKVSETSNRMYNSVLDAHEKSKELDKAYKDLTKEVQILSKEKEAIEKQRTEAIKKRAKLELDDKDLQEKISTNIKAKVIFEYIRLFIDLTLLFSGTCISFCDWTCSFADMFVCLGGYSEAA